MFLVWFGLIKLSIQGYSGGAGLPRGVATNSWISLGITMAIIVAIPFLVDVVASKVMITIRKKRGQCISCGEAVVEGTEKCSDCTPEVEKVEEVELLEEVE